MKQSTAWIVLIVISIIILGPLLFYLSPPYIFSPDIQYVQGKVLRVLEGELYNDPITGFPTFHPPYFHCVLAGMVWLGMELDQALLSAIVMAVCLSIFFMYKLTESRFGPETALYSVLLLPLMVESINYMNLLLPSAFYFSVPFFLAALWLYFREETKYRFTIGYGILWGLAFIISPGYLFLIGLLLISEIVIRRRTKHFFVAATALLVTMTPFFIHAYIIFSNDMFGTAAFTVWPGWPDLSFLKSLGFHLISPGGYSLDKPLVWAALLAVVVAIVALIKNKENKGLIAMAAASYLLTFYHYLPRYACRIYLFVMILLIPSAISVLSGMKLRKWLGRIIISGLIVVGLYYHYDDLLNTYEGQVEDLTLHRAMMEKTVINQFYTHFRPEDIILVSSETYRFNVLPYVPVHALLAWRSGEYYQLKSEISSSMAADYDSLMQCRDTICLNHFCDKYNIRVALLSGIDDTDQIPVFGVLGKNWRSVYGGEYFRIYNKD